MQGLETIIFMCWSVNLSSIELLHNPVLVIALYLKPYTLNLQLLVCACVCVCTVTRVKQMCVHTVFHEYIFTVILLFLVWTKSIHLSLNLLTELSNKNNCLHLNWAQIVW